MILVRKSGNVFDGAIFALLSLLVCGIAVHIFAGEDGQTTANVVAAAQAIPNQPNVARGDDAR
jgi:hypothetical protein